MIVCIGIDVCSIDRMRRVLARNTGDRFAERILSPRERSDYPRDVATFVAGRFAAKEAFSKALDGARGVRWHDVEVVRLPSGRPTIELKDTAVAAMNAAGADSCHLSITHDGGVAAAVVVLERRNP